MYDSLFSRRFPLDERAEHATYVELDLGAWRACVRAPDAEAEVENDLRFAEALNPEGIPFFLVNGKRVIRGTWVELVPAELLSSRAR